MKLGGDAIFGGIIIGTIATLFWPVIAVFVLVKMLHTDWQAVITPRPVKKQDELLRREQRVKEMERELGIK